MAPVNAAQMVPSDIPHFNVVHRNLGISRSLPEFSLLGWRFR